MFYRMTTKSDLQPTRFILLDAILRWEGRLNNARLRELFGLSTVRASEWIREFRDQHPHWMVWDSKKRGYHATLEAYKAERQTDARRLENSASLAHYLTLVGMPHAASESSQNRIVWAAFPDLSIPHPKIFASLSEAIRTQCAVEITYRSMREPAPHKRMIFPHSVIRAGRRWHTRAYCALNKDFRDYALGRIADTKLLETPSDHFEEDDAAWVAKVPVRLVAHPDLTPEQEDLIRFEYFNNTASQVETCRGSLVNYFIQDVRAAIDTTLQRPPEYQLAVQNIDEVKPWLFPG